MEDRETPRMHKYGESKTTQIVMATVRHVTSGLGQKILGHLIFDEQKVHRVLYASVKLLCILLWSSFFDT
jgi:Cft2 family RNA processing exonuclease